MAVRVDDPHGILPPLPPVEVSKVEVMRLGDDINFLKKDMQGIKEKNI